MRTIHQGSFETFNNSLYGTAAAMAVAAPLATQGTPRSQFVWGSYQKRVVPHQVLWPVVTSHSGRQVSTWDTYKRSIDLQRASLAFIPNTDPLSPDEPNHVPPTRLDLLDEAVRKAFYSNPPIPFDVNVQNASGTTHELQVDWDVDADGNPTMLHLTIFCP